MSGSLSIAVLTDSQALSPLLSQYLSTDRYVCQYFTSKEGFLAAIEGHQNEIDCLIFSAEVDLLPTVNSLSEQGILLPAVILQTNTADDSTIEFTACEPGQTPAPIPQNYIYQPSEVLLGNNCVTNIEGAIERAVAKFLNLKPVVRSPQPSAPPQEIPIDIPKVNLFLQQQRRLADKLKERLGYLAVYYKRNSRQFFRHLDRAQQQELLSQLRVLYREIVLQYFSSDTQTNAIVDEFVSLAFFADLSVSEIVKIHMELMEEFSKQLKLEGRSEEILLDYRLTLIDIIAHLCEMYRRSIPREM